VDKPIWPFGAADHLTPDYAAIVEAAINNQLTIIEPAILAGVLQLDLDIDPEVRKGAIIAVKIKAAALGQDVTFGAGIDGPMLVGAAGKTKTQTFVYDGTNFIAVGASVQID
jgi:hypothetical protein